MSIANIRTIAQNRTDLLIGAATTDDLTSAAFDLEIDRAVLDYSMDEPRKILVDKLAADLTDVGGVKFFDLTAEGWSFDHSDPSDIVVEFPIDLTRTTTLKRGASDDWEYTERPVATVRTAFIRFFAVPDDNWRLEFKTNHLTIAGDATLAGLSLRNTQMVGLLAAIYAARSLSGRFAKTQKPALGEDVVDHQARSTLFDTQADKLWEEYQDALDRPSRIKRPGLDMDIVDLDVTVQKNRRTGRDYLVHRRRIR